MAVKVIATVAVKVIATVAVMATVVVMAVAAVAVMAVAAVVVMAVAAVAVTVIASARGPGGRDLLQRAPPASMKCRSRRNSTARPLPTLAISVRVIRRAVHAAGGTERIGPRSGRESASP